MLNKPSSLFTPYQLRGTTFPNRLVLAPMMQYRAIDGFVSDWHIVHLGKFALGGFGAVMTEVVAVEKTGRISCGDLGLWSDEQIVGLKRCTDFIHSQGSLAAIQIGHAGRKASTRRAWEGSSALTQEDAAKGDHPWQPVGPTDVPYGKDFPKPHALTIKEIERLVQSFAQTAARADRAGFDVIEIHGAHGYLISSFLSPITNTRSDIYGGDRKGRMRFSLEIATAIREVWPKEKPLFFRISAQDGGGPEGWGMEDSLAIAPLLKDAGVDLIDCSSGGIQGSATVQNTKLGLGYQVPFSDQIKNITKVPTMAVGLILTPEQAQDIIDSGQADLIALGRQALYDPYWPLHARQHLSPDAEFENWPVEPGWWLKKRAVAISNFGLTPSGSPVGKFEPS
jgi:2,4-dienoyl-CoA reductase-like NADH-dependent reductase (Old Yellow Enzyme family)